MSRYGLLAGVMGLVWAGCSAPAEEVEDAPTLPPPGFVMGQAGSVGAAPVGAAGASGAAAVTPAPVNGAGGSAMQAAAGAGGAPPVAAGGAAGGTGNPAIPAGTGTLITHDSTGWVAGTTNGVGIQGSFYPFGDASGTPPGDTTVELGDFAASPTTVCASGVASEVLEGDYTRYWGGGIGLNLADPGGMPGVTGPWAPGSVTGFSFNVTGPTIPPNIRINATTLTGPTYCLDDIPTAGATQVQLASMVTDCYQAGGMLMPAGTALASLQWQVVTVIDASTPFDFCIENLTALTAP